MEILNFQPKQFLPSVCTYKNKPINKIRFCFVAKELITIIKFTINNLNFIKSFKDLSLNLLINPLIYKFKGLEHQSRCQFTLNVN